MNALAIAIALSIASAGAYAAGAVVQERVAAHGTGILASLRLPHWWLSVALNGAGAGLHVGALAFGPLSIVQPLGLLTLVVALPMGAAVIGRRVAGVHWRGAGLTIAGLVLLVITAPLGSARELDSTEILTVAMIGGAIVVGLTLLARQITAPVPSGLLYAVAAGIAFACSSALTQTVSLQVTADGPLALISTAAFTLAAFMASGVMLSQAAYRDGGLGAPLATVSLSNPVASAAVGMLLLEERFVGGFTGGAVALTGGILAVAGVLLLTRPADGHDAVSETPETHGGDQAAPQDPAASTSGRATTTGTRSGSVPDSQGPSPDSRTSPAAAQDPPEAPQAALPIPGRRRAQIAVGERGQPSCAVPGGPRRRLLRPGRGFHPRPGRRPST
ncbi:DMT family transporter [Catenuloplanes sp. NPDC051500]|uniref:DMT family transporter n=1 Tax=Catenuloplanes sp. NPDC051500 TaxID=3363959 RepID=UPI00378C0898